MPDEIVFEKKAPGQITTHKKRLKNKNNGIFHDELRKLMVAYGDNEKPNEASVELLEVFVEEYSALLLEDKVEK